MSSTKTPPPKPDGRKDPKHRIPKSIANPETQVPTLDSVLGFFKEFPTTNNKRVLTLVSVRRQLDSLVREARFIDQPNLQGPGGGTEIPAEELTQALNELVKIGAKLRKVIPGLFLIESRDEHEAKQIGIAHLALARYFAVLDGSGGAQGIMSAANQVDALLKGNGTILVPAVTPSMPAEVSLGSSPAQAIHLGEVPLLDLLLPQWRKIGDPTWVSPLGRYRGNWIEQAFMPVFELLSKQLLMLFLLRGWPLEAFTQSRSQAREHYFDAFIRVLQLSGKSGIAQRSLYPHLKHACQWAETAEAQKEMNLLLHSDRARARVAQVLARAKKQSVQI